MTHVHGRPGDRGEVGADLWRDPWGPTGEALDRLLSPGQFVVTEPDMSEFVCADRLQLLKKLDECEARGFEPAVRWCRGDGTVERHPGRPPDDWGIEGPQAT